MWSIKHAWIKRQNVTSIYEYIYAQRQLQNKRATILWLNVNIKIAFRRGEEIK